VVAELRGPAPGALVQLNHPRTYHGAGEDLAFFDHLSVGEHFEPRLPLGNVQNRSLIEVDPVSGLRDLDFDTLELANGASLAEYQQVRADWLSLLLQGEYRPAVASSDSHEASIPVAIPRSYVRYAGPRRHPLDVAAVVDAVRAGAVMGSTGPLPELQLEDEQGVVSGVGATAGGRRFTLRLRAQAAPWVDVSQVWVYVNGSVLRGTTIRAGEWLSLPLEIERDSFVTVEFYGEAGETYRSLAPGHTPMAFTNPIWIDADRDGRWTPPGLLPLPLAVSRPASIPSAPPEEVPEAAAP
jgi:hypothetical protein